MQRTPNQINAVWFTELNAAVYNQHIYIRSRSLHQCKNISEIINELIRGTLLQQYYSKETVCILGMNILAACASLNRQ